MKTLGTKSLKENLQIGNKITALMLLFIVLMIALQLFFKPSIQVPFASENQDIFKGKEAKPASFTPVKQ